MRYKTFFIIVISMLLASCEQHKKNLPFYGNEPSKADTAEQAQTQKTPHITYNDSNEVAVPFIEQRGVKLIDVTVNGKFTIKMILDSGSSNTLISIAEAKYLYEKGCFTQDDILGMTQSQIANGSIVENMVIRLRELVIGGQISCPNVISTVSTNTQAPLLLGNEVLNRATSYSVDNKNKLIRFKLQ